MPTLLICLSEGQLADLDRARQIASSYEVVRAEREADIRAVLAEVEVVLGYLPPALVSEAPRLRWIQSWSAGLDWLVEHDAFDATAHPDLVVTSASGVHAVPIGEHVFAVLLAFSRKLPRALRDQRDRRWGPGEDYTDVFEWLGKRLVMIGAGAIAAAVARGARVIAVDIDGHKLDLAKSLGAQHTIHSKESELHRELERITGGDGPDVVVEAAGNPLTYRAAVEEVAFTGRVVCIGYAGEEVSFATKLFVQKELDILGSRNATPEDYKEVISYLERGTFPLNRMITAKVRPEEASGAVKKWAGDPGKVMKILLDFNS